MKLATVIGARPQFIKAAMVSRAIREHNRHLRRPRIEELIVHTGQHYDDNMSDVFFRELGIPAPHYNLGVGSGSQGVQTGAMLSAIEAVLIRVKPDWVLVYGDTNSTLAGALAASKLHVPVAHVEAGLRSFNRRMPEEINRVVTDHVSSLLLCPTGAAVTNLDKEGIVTGVHHVGDVMYDAALFYGRKAKKRQRILSDLMLKPKSYYLATLHRAENTDDARRFISILLALEQIASAECPVVFPAHPRVRRLLGGRRRRLSDHLLVIEPVSFLGMVNLERSARVILTDSGGVQKEAYFHGVPCVTMRDETEWMETVEAGWNQVVGAETKRIIGALSRSKTGRNIVEYGQGNSAKRIVEIIAAIPPS